MPATPDALGTATSVLWNIPAEVSSNPSIDNVKVWRSQSSENTGYTFLADVPRVTGAAIPTSYVDPTIANRQAFYLVTFTAGASGSPEYYESSYNTTYFYPTPRELRLIETIKRSMPEVISRCGVGLNDSDYMVGLRLAVQIFNTYPPETHFTWENFPSSHEYFLIGLAQLTTLASRYLPLSIRDWSYSEPGGVVMQVDRGAKISQAIQIISNVYSQYLPIVKLDFSSDFPTGVGTVQLPLSMGGVVSRGMLNVLDIFTATGR